MNYCLPGYSYSDIMQKILSYKFCQDTTLVIFVGNRGNVSKKELITYHNTLCNHGLKKIVMFTFPYSKSLPQEENAVRYKLNMTLHNLTFYNNDSIHLIDTNNYVSNYFYLTKDRYYLSIYFKRQIAVSLSYYLHISAKNLATTVAFIEQHPDFDIYNNSAKYLATHDDMYVQCNLN